MTPGWQTTSGWLARVLVAGVFAYAAFPKLFDPAGFAAAIDNYHLLPSGLTRLIAVGLPVLEACVAAALLIPRLSRGACVLAALLLMGFSIAMVQALLRDIDLDCGCFGADDQASVSGWSVARNLVLCALTVWSLWVIRVPQQRATGTLTPS